MFDIGLFDSKEIPYSMLIMFILPNVNAYYSNICMLHTYLFNTEVSSQIQTAKNLYLRRSCIIMM